MKKSSIIAVTALFVGFAAFAAPSRMRPISVVGPDGTPVTVVPVGDESNHCFLTEDGKVAEWMPRSTVAKAPRLRRMKTTSADWSDGDQAAVSAALVNKPPRDGRYLVVLVDFPDRKFTVEDAGVEFNAMLNSPGYSNYSATGSVRDYFVDNSCGEFIPQFDVIGPVTTPKRASYYASSGTDDSPAGLMVIDICSAIDEEVDFSVYDTDSDGIVDNVYFFYAGLGQADGGDQTTIWPHSWSLSKQDRELRLDGVQIDNYACSPELDGARKINGIGTFCHEFCHVLGLPDLYGTNVNHPAKYSLMASGNYNNDGRTPPNLSVFERYCLGWIEPRDLVYPKSVELSSISDNEAWRIPTERANEFFLLENRQLEGWDIDIPGHGMLVWHIDYNPDIWDRNVVNRNGSHQYVDIVEANGGTSASAAAGFTFPGTGRKTSFTSSTTPALKSWAGIAVDVPLTDISETVDGVVTFNAKGGKAPVGDLVGLSAEAINPEEISVSWNATPGAVAYQVLARMISTESSGDEISVRVETTSAIIGPVQPGERYEVSVAACDEYEAGRASTVEVGMPEATFEYLTPVLSEATMVTPISFSVGWEAVAGADSYELTVCKVVKGVESTVTADFTGKVLPDGWVASSLSWNSAPGYFGDAAPALRMDADGASLTIVADAAIRSLSWWMRGSNIADGVAMKVDIADVESPGWKEIARYSLTADGKQVVIDEREIPENTLTMRLVFVKTDKATVSVDDISVVSAPESVAGVDGWTARNVGDTESAIVDGLQSNCTYVCTLTALCGQLRSRSSLPLRVITPDVSGLMNVVSDDAYTVAIYGIDGRQIAMPAGQLPSGIYIQRLSDGTSRKILIR